MEELVLKRPANITSAEALDEISESYPDAEILSFRRIKEASGSSELFVARVRVAVMADESDDIVLDSSDVVVENKEHEDKEEARMDKIVELLTEVLDELKTESDAAENGLDDLQLEMEEMPVENDVRPPAPNEDDDPYAKIPEQVKPPVGSGVISNLKVSRPANVSKKQARLELIREFSPEGYKIKSVEKIDNHYIASLEKISDSKKRRERIRKERDELPQREDRSMAPGTGQAEWQKFPYVGSPSARAAYMRSAIRGYNYGEDFPEPKPPKDVSERTPEAMREFAKQKKRWEKAYEMADSRLAVPEYVENYLQAYHDVLMANKKLNQDQVIEESNKEYKKVMSMPSREDRIEYFLEQEDYLAEGLKKEKQQRRRDFTFPSEQLGQRGEMTEEGRKELLRRRDPSVEVLPKSEKGFVSQEEMESDLLSLVATKPYEGDKQSAYDILAERKKLWEQPEQYVSDMYDDQIAMFELEIDELQSSGGSKEDIRKVMQSLSRLREEKDQQVAYLSKNADQNKRAYYDALSAVARLDKKDQAKYLESSKWYGPKGPSPLPGQVPSGIGTRQEAPGSIERQRQTWRPTPTPESVEQSAGTPRSQAEDLMNWYRKNKRVIELKEQQQKPRVPLGEMQDARQEFGVPEDQEEWFPDEEQAAEWNRRVEELREQAGGNQ